ncbi:MAG: hypothetical protein ACN6N0_14915, partial [Microvirgula sp.]
MLFLPVFFLMADRTYSSMEVVMKSSAAGARGSSGSSPRNGHWRKPLHAKRRRRLDRFWLGVLVRRQSTLLRNQWRSGMAMPAWLRWMFAAVLRGGRAALLTALVGQAAMAGQGHRGDTRDFQVAKAMACGTDPHTGAPLPCLRQLDAEAEGSGMTMPSISTIGYALAAGGGIALLVSAGGGGSSASKESTAEKQDSPAGDAAPGAAPRKTPVSAQRTNREQAQNPGENEAERIEAERLAEEKRKEAERIEAERLAEEKRKEAERIEAERLAEEKRKEAERIEAERIAAERRKEAERQAASQPVLLTIAKEQTHMHSGPESNVNLTVHGELHNLGSGILNMVRDGTGTGNSNSLFGGILRNDGILNLTARLYAYGQSKVLNQSGGKITLQGNAAIYVDGNSQFINDGAITASGYEAIAGNARPAVILSLAGGSPDRPNGRGGSIP